MATWSFSSSVAKICPTLNSIAEASRFGFSG